MLSSKFTLFTSLERHRDPATRNVRSVARNIDTVLLEKLVTLDPRATALTELVKERPDLFANTTYEKVRQRYKYLFNKRTNDSDSFFGLLENHSIEASSEVKIAILQENLTSSSKKKPPSKSSLKKNTTSKKNISRSSSCSATRSLTSSFDSPTPVSSSTIPFASGYHITTHNSP